MLFFKILHHLPVTNIIGVYFTANKLKLIPENEEDKIETGGTESYTIRCSIGNIKI